MKIFKLDGTNYVERDIPLATGGSATIPGITVRALRKILENADPDAMVTYIFEQDGKVNFGVIAGGGFNDDVLMLVGPEVAHAQPPEERGIEPVNRAAVATTDNRPLDQRPETDDPSGQHSNYLVLSDEERAKGFQRPVRHAYIHLTCGAVTTMGAKIAETYARDPQFYGATYCSKCRGHFPVGEDGEFVWDDDSRAKVGT